ncbi:hypothetical protein QOZ80_3AG0225750 [Eleusine coracana subsp. coracana]|nr:hypothetical protein QOZ80_3AG0225750 [Eleusine coracana subsp. coracana]
MASDDEELEDVDSEGVEMEEDDGDDGHLEDEDDVSVREPPVKCSAITKEALCNAQQEDLTAVMNLFNITQHHARAVLIRYRWNMERITDHMERKGQDIMLMEAGVVSHQESASCAAGSRRVITCGVCFEDLSLRKVSTMDCGHSFCNDCWTGYFVSSLDSGKKQIRCMALMWERWEAKCLGEAENVKWLLANTKTCPKCFKPIIKEGGCNHVTCSCGQYLCWLCGVATGLAHDYDRIHGHSCNRFDEDEKRRVSDAQQQLQPLGPALVENVIDGLESHDSVLYQNAAQSLADSHRTLLVCRQVLSRSFVFAYYMFHEDVSTTTQEGTLLAQAKELFENYQQGVEALVEKLTRRRRPSCRRRTRRRRSSSRSLRGRRRGLSTTPATIEAHCGKMYACIQDELLPMLVEPMVIAPFQKKGPLKADKE